MQRKPDKFETGFRGFWYALWGFYALICVFNFEFLQFAFWLALLNFSTFCFVRFRRWLQDRDD